MNSSRRSWYGILIALLSFLMVGGALLTALAQTQFSLEKPADPFPTATDVNLQPATETTIPAAPTAIDVTDTQQAESPATATESPTDTLTAPTESTNTPFTFTPVDTQPGDTSISCGPPTNWIQYTVVSGDTLFSISKTYQTTVYNLQVANCMVGVTKIITGSKLWVPNNPTITPPPTSTATATKKVPGPTCYSLTLTHSGNGADPVPGISNSTGCPAGKYIVGDTITLSATPDPGWQIDSWTGTENATSNKVIMPAKDHSASVVYSAIPPTCYTLTITHSGNGTNPVPNKTNSTGCPAGKYIAGDTLTLSATPDPGWQIDSWTGTENATSNKVIMPAKDHSASVVYVPIPPVCFTLTLSHTGNGTDPVPNLTNSTGCPAGKYIAGETFTLSATPDPGWQIDSWTGTENATSNKVIMPASNHSASVIYTMP